MKKLIALCLSAIMLLTLGVYVSGVHVIGDSIGDGSLAAQGETQTDHTQDSEIVLPQVENLSFVKSLRGAVILSWDKTEGAYAYNIFVKTNKDKKFKYCLTVKNNNVTVNIDNEGGLQFKVRAFCYDSGKAVFGDFSEAVGGVTAPAGVSKLYTSKIENDSITLYWNKAAGATGYRVYIYDRDKKKFVLYKRTSRTIMTVASLKRDTLYTFKVLSYKRIDNSTAFGDYSEEYKEYTYNSGSLPHTKAQAAQFYNNYINKLKQEQNMTVAYKKSIDTQYISCTKKNLATSVKNTLNLFQGTLNETCKYVNGESDAKSVNKLIEPYGKNAGLERDDIKKYTAKKDGDSIILTVTLKSENKYYNRGKKMQKSYYDSVLSLPNYKSLKTAPFVIESADSYYSGGTMAIKVTEKAVTYFKVDAAVLSNIGFSVSEIKGNAIIAYELKENYKITYPK